VARRSSLCCVPLSQGSYVVAPKSWRFLRDAGRGMRTPPLAGGDPPRLNEGRGPSSGTTSPSKKPLTPTGRRTKPCASTRGPRPRQHAFCRRARNRAACGEISSMPTGPAGGPCLPSGFVASREAGEPVSCARSAPAAIFNGDPLEGEDTQKLMVARGRRR
jgi:hypothetical protein